MVIEYILFWHKTVYKATIDFEVQSLLNMAQSAIEPYRSNRWSNWTEAAISQINVDKADESDRNIIIRYGFLHNILWISDFSGNHISETILH